MLNLHLLAVRVIEVNMRSKEQVKEVIARLKN